MIAVGAKLSVNFPVRVVYGGVVREVIFAELLTRRTIVSIYMRNNTPSCDRQVEALANDAEGLGRLGYNLVAVSRDTAGSQRRRAEKLGLAGGALVLVSDPDDLFANAADAVVDKVLYGRKYRGPARSAFVLATDGTVLAVIEKVDTKTHAEQLRAVVAELG
jgi:thioredoxin-dependent peroxiredoxin